MTELPFYWENLRIGKTRLFNDKRWVASEILFYVIRIKVPRELTANYLQELRSERFFRRIGHMLSAVDGILNRSVR